MKNVFETVVPAVRSLAAYVGVSLWVLVCGPPGMLLALATGRPNALYVLGRLGVRIGLGAAGIRCGVAGQQHIQRGRAAVYCVNHASNVEPPILYMALAALHPRLRILYKAQIHKLPVLGRAFDIAGFVPIERRSARRSMQAILQAAAAVRAGNSFLVFPEGTRSRTGALLPFKPGVFLIAARAGAPIVPVAIQGTRDAMRKGSPVVRPVTVSVRIGAPIESGAPGGEAALLERTRAAVADLLAQGPIQRSAADEERQRPGR